MPSGAIALVAATDDGSAVVTSDTSGGLRLWPSLDGRREPVVIAVSNPTRELSIERNGAELVIARLDDTGTLELIRTTELGAPLGRFTAASELPLSQVHAVETGVVALRDDGALIRLDLTAHLVAALMPDPGQRIESLLARHHHMVALISSESGVTGRWLEVDPLRWGPRTARLAIEPDHAALSPDGKLIATTDKTHSKALVVELASGKIVARPTAVDSEPGFDRIAIVGFLDMATLALMVDGTLMWWQGNELKPMTDPTFVRPVATDRHLIGPQGAELVVISPYATQHLGYRMGSPTRFRVVPGGVLIGGAGTLLRIDDDFTERVRYQLGPQLADSVPIDGHHVVATSQDDGGVYLVNLDDPANPNQIARGVAMKYEPSTRLLAIEQPQAVLFARYDPKSGTFDDPTTLAVPDLDSGNGTLSVELLDPAISGGKIALIIRQDFGFEGVPGAVHVIDVRSARRGTDPVASPPRRFPLTGDLLTQLSHGDRRAFGLPISTRRKSPDGKLVAELGEGRITLRRAAGETVWVVPAQGIDQLAWTANGELFGFGAGIGVLSPATGAFERRQCGWDFGLWQEAVPSSGGGSQMCDLR
jgi:hypothetical protein